MRFCCFLSRAIFLNAIAIVVYDGDSNHQLPAGKCKSFTSRTDRRSPLNGLDLSVQIYSSSAWSSWGCPADAVKCARSSTRFLSWICTSQILHNILWRQVRIKMICCRSWSVWSICPTCARFLYGFLTRDFFLRFVFPDRFEIRLL